MEIVDVTTEKVPPLTPVSVAARRPRRRFRIAKSKKTVVGLVMLGFFLVLAVIGPWVAPYAPGTQ